jgi:hypothetical protein
MVNIFKKIEEALGINLPDLEVSEINTDAVARCILYQIVGDPTCTLNADPTIGRIAENQGNFPLTPDLVAVNLGFDRPIFGQSDKHAAAVAECELMLTQLAEMNMVSRSNRDPQCYSVSLTQLPVLIDFIKPSDPK